MKSYELKYGCNPHQKPYCRRTKYDTKAAANQ